MRQSAENQQLALDDLGNGTPGISPEYGWSLAQAAAVCLDSQGHSSPTEMPVGGDASAEIDLEWEAPDERARRTWADMEFATEQGAYGIATLLVPKISDWTVAERSRKGTGFDYWLADQSDEGPLFQNKARLEVSGILSGTDSKVSGRVKQKLEQTTPSDGVLPALVVVVEFGSPKSKVAKKCVK